MKTCTKCKQIKPISSFVKGKCYRDGYRPSCKECNYPAIAKWGRENKDRQRLYHRRYGWKNDYNITEEQYLNLLDSQGNKCSICRELPKLDRILTVDHCHKTGRVRGLLCDRCNRGLGQFQDSIPVMKLALAYLEKACQS